MKRVWRYIVNVFEAATRNSYKKMLLLIVDSTSKLQAQKADPDIDALFVRTDPVSTDYSLAYSTWTSATGKRKGETQRFTDKLTELNDVKSKQWEKQVTDKYEEGTPDYKRIFPNGSSMFREGTYEERVNRLQSLGLTLADYPALAATKTEVDNYYRDILGIRNVQTQHDEMVKVASDMLEQKRILAADILFANLGKLMDKFNNDPSLIERFYNLKLLRTYISDNGDTPVPEPVTGKVGSLQSTALLEGGFDANSLISLANLGGTTLKFYTAKLPTDPVPGTTVDLLPGEEAEVFASDLGADTNLFLMVFNPDKINEGEYSYLLMDQTEEE